MPNQRGGRCPMHLELRDGQVPSAARRVGSFHPALGRVTRTASLALSYWPSAPTAARTNRPSVRAQGPGAIWRWVGVRAHRIGDQRFRGRARFTGVQVSSS